jgi:hypothetical protein
MGDTCAVCLETTTPMTTLRCKHTFHKQCLIPIDKGDTGRKCPLCRSHFVLDTLPYLTLGGKQKMYEPGLGERIYSDDMYIYITDTTGLNISQRLLRVPPQDESFDETFDDDYVYTPQIVTIPKVLRKYDVKK